MKPKIQKIILLNIALLIVVIYYIAISYNILTSQYEVKSLKLDDKIKSIRYKNMDVLYECGFDYNYICSKLHKNGYPKLIK